MVEQSGSRQWADSHTAQVGRAPRAFLPEALDQRDAPAAGAVAVDLGCGDGTESRHLVRHGWTVLAIGSAPGVHERVRGDLEPTQLERLTVAQVALEQLTALPASDVVHAGFAAVQPTGGREPA